MPFMVQPKGFCISRTNIFTKTGGILISKFERPINPTFILKNQWGKQATFFQKLSISNHLTKIKSRESRSLISKLRLGVLPLEIERGRRKNVPKEQRFCKLCNSEQVENEPHFIFDCPALENYRSPFISDLSRNVPFFHNLNSSQKLQFLFFNDLTPNHALETAAKLIVDLFNARKLLLNP